MDDDARGALFQFGNRTLANRAHHVNPIGRLLLHGGPSWLGQREHRIAFTVLLQRHLDSREHAAGSLHPQVERGVLADELVGLPNLNRGTRRATAPPPGAGKNNGREHDEKREELEQDAHPLDHNAEAMRPSCA
jgi:hypothetical protein